VSELVQAPLDYIGYCDASVWEAGGIWFGGQQQLHAVIWRIQWPQDMTNAVISESNPNGMMTNLDLEMAGVLLYKTVLKATIQPTMWAAQMTIGSNNLPAVAWTTRMATCRTSPILYHLLKGFAMCQRITSPHPQPSITARVSPKLWLMLSLARSLALLPIAFISWISCQVLCFPKHFSPKLIHSIPSHSNGPGTMSCQLQTYGQM
jgi:hypothetical protein